MSKNEPSISTTELYNEMSFCIAYCIGANYDNAEQIANSVTIEQIEECIDQIRMIMNKKEA